MTIPMLESTARRSSPASDAITVLLVADDEQSREHVAETLSDDEECSVRTTASLPESPLEDVDCLVIESGRSTRADGSLRERVEYLAAEQPVVLWGDPAGGFDADTDAVDAIRSSEWLDWVPRDESAAALERLGHRIRRLTDHRRTTSLARRALASVELAEDAIAIVAPDDTIKFANRSFAMQFGYDREELVGRSWRTLFTADSVDRLESTAIPTVADGWRWTGTCTGRQKSGSTVPVSVRLGGPEDGSLVFVVDTPADDGAGDGDLDRAN